MADESHSFSTARTRLEEIVTQVRKKDTSLEKSLDLLEEGVRLANACTELIDHADWVGEQAAGSPDAVEGAREAAISDLDSVADDSADEMLGEPALGEDESGAEGERPQGPEVASESASVEADDGYDDAWADDEAPADELGADDDPSADER